MNNLFLYIKTLFKLGISNVLYVLWYRFTLKSGIRKFWFPVSEISSDQDYFKSTQLRTNYPEEWKESLLQDANKFISGEIRYYGYHWKQTGNPPNWFLNPFNGKEFPNTSIHWTKIPDFNEEVGDIKNTWEASRFEWLITLARAYSATGNEAYLKTINIWIKDWTTRNPLNAGPNWKCGQEAGIRLIALVNASLILDQEKKPTKALLNLIHAHLKRISANILYGIAQDNNHGTSEAAALFIGGAYLKNADPLAYPNAKLYVRKGRRWLENRVQKLIKEDGSFSQHSVNYHRLMLDTLSFCELWRKKLNQKDFSFLFYRRTKEATNWLYQMTDHYSGSAVNLGANDGALLNNLSSANYKDFRPSLQLASALFLKTPLFDDGPWNESLWWLNIKSNTINKALKPLSKVFATGYVRMEGNASWSLLRFPYFKFRPSHNDVFHFDLWYKGENILCDAGSYSYNSPAEDAAIDLKSVNKHNTVSFDGQEQMPKLSRFLLGKWLKSNYIGNFETSPSGAISWEGSYFDNYNNKHHRKILVENNTWIIEDVLTGNFNSAIIGFNVNTLDCNLLENHLKFSFGTITLPKQSQCYLNKTVISEYYFCKREITRLNMRITKPGNYTTIVILN